MAPTGVAILAQGLAVLTGTCELNEDGYATLYSGDDVYATLFFAREKYFYVENGQAAEVVTKISDTAMLP